MVLKRDREEKRRRFRSSLASRPPPTFPAPTVSPDKAAACHQRQENSCLSWDNGCWGQQLSPRPPAWPSCSGQGEALTPTPAPSSNVSRGFIMDPFLSPPLPSVRHPHRLSPPMVCAIHKPTPAVIFPQNTHRPHMLSVVTHTQSSWPQQGFLTQGVMSCHSHPLSVSHTLLMSPCPIRTQDQVRHL